MNIIIPMAGAGQRFADEGYTTHKPAIPTTYRKTGEVLPMVVCAVKDLPCVEPDGSNVFFIDRTFHKADGVEETIKEHYPKASFITIENLTEGQACTCLLAKEYIDNDEPLLIAGCDNGMVLDKNSFLQMTGKCDVLAFTYRNNPAVLVNPNAYGWLRVDTMQRITSLSIKKAISPTPMNDHAIVATFWFKHGKQFVQATEKMIIENDRINNEFYVDQVMKHCIELGMDARVFEIDRYIGWGTPKDYENYEKSYAYWTRFVNSDAFLPKSR